jgi:hypothetical protein
LKYHQKCLILLKTCHLYQRFLVNHEFSFLVGFYVAPTPVEVTRRVDFLALHMEKYIISGTNIRSIIKQKKFLMYIYYTDHMHHFNFFNLNRLDAGKLTLTFNKPVIEKKSNVWTNMLFSLQSHTDTCGLPLQQLFSA